MSSIASYLFISLCYWLTLKWRAVMVLVILRHILIAHIINNWRYIYLCHIFLGPPWSWSYGSWIYNYLCNQFLSPLMLWVRTPLRRGVLDTTLCDKVCQWFATGCWFSPGTPVSSTNKTDCYKITEIFLKVTLNTINHPTLKWNHCDLV